MAPPAPGLFRLGLKGSVMYMTDIDTALNAEIGEVLDIGPEYEALGEDEGLFLRKSRQRDGRRKVRRNNS